MKLLEIASQPRKVLLNIIHDGLSLMPSPDARKIMSSYKCAEREDVDSLSNEELQAMASSVENFLNAQQRDVLQGNAD